jgi:hypothetical protein
LPVDAVVYVATDGGVREAAGVDGNPSPTAPTGAATGADIAIAVDGVVNKIPASAGGPPGPPGGFQRVSETQAINGAVFGYWSMSQTRTLPAGTHVISVMGRWAFGLNRIGVSGGTADVRQGELTVIVLTPQ